jgi:CTP:molybdopterin cytidylyltransferase MocA
MPDFTCGLVLGAGGSKRLGRPKQTLPFRDGTLLGHVVGVARECGFDQLVVAIGGAADEVRAAGRPERGGGGRQRRLRRGLLVLDRGGAGGGRRALRRARADARRPAGRDGGDRARAAGGRGGAELAVCRYDDGRGHPIAFARSLFGALATCTATRACGSSSTGARRTCRSTAASRSTSTPPRTTRRSGERAVEELAQRLAAVDYLVDEGLATSMFLALRLPQPLLLEGEAGVGKTEAARSLAMVLDTPLVRLQCYEGIDAAEALYEWNYPRQLLSIRLAEAAGEKLGEEDLFSPDYLIRRPLLRALEHPGPRPRCC